MRSVAPDQCQKKRISEQYATSPLRKPKKLLNSSSSLPNNSRRAKDLEVLIVI